MTIHIEKSKDTTPPRVSIPVTEEDRLTLRKIFFNIHTRFIIMYEKDGDGITNVLKRRNLNIKSINNDTLFTGSIESENFALCK